MSNPMNPSKDELSADDISWEMAQDEISKQTELRVEKEAGKEPDQPKTKGKACAREADKRSPHKARV